MRFQPRALIGTIACTCIMAMTSLVSHAQFLDVQPIHLSPTETSRLKEVLDTPIDPNQLNSAKIEWHKKKELAAVALGDMAAREKNLREWMTIDEEGAWILRSYLAGTERRSEAYEIGHQIINKTNFPPSKARMMIFVADNYVEDGDLSNANALLSRAEGIVKTMPRSARDGTGQYLLGDTEVLFHMVKSKFLRRSGKLTEAIASAQSAVEKSRSQIEVEHITNDRHRHMGRNNYLRGLYLLAAEQTATGAYVQAETSLREAYGALKKFGFNEALMTGFYMAVADLYNANGDFKEALTFARRGEAIILKNGFLPGSIHWVHAQNRINTALTGQNNWQEALRNFERVDQTLQQINFNTAMANQADVRGMTYIRNGKYDQAVKVLSNAHRWDQANLGAEHHQTALIEGLLACALLGQGELQQARGHFEKSAKHIASPETLTGDMTETALRRKVKKFIFQSYAKLLATQAKQNPTDAELLFQIADQSNTSSVQQAIAEAAVRSGISVPGLAEIIRQEQDAKNEIASLTSYIRNQDTAEGHKQTPQVLEQMRGRLKDLENQRKSYKAQIQKQFPEYFQLIQPKPATHREIASRLAKDELFVALIPMEEQTYIWAIDHQGLVGFESAKLREQDIAAAVEKIRKTLDVAELGQRAPKFDFDSAFTLYKHLFQPFEKSIQTKKHLIVSTTGAMAKLPFAVMTQAPFAGSDYTKAPWLIRDVAVSHVPNASSWLALKRLSQHTSAPEALLAWGDPAFDPLAPTPQTGNHAVRSVAVTRSIEGPQRNVMDAATFLAYSKIPPLPETRQEVTELASIVHADPKKDLILGPEATRASVLRESQSGQLAKKKIVVFATHGLLAGDLPNLNQPALAMASSKDPLASPLLTLEDVLSLKLNADWVVLSACNTAGADGRAEEAMSGLARGFFYAGSRSLLVTHWSVESESAMMLTTRTFNAYEKDHRIRRAEALRLAMLETMKSPQFAHPTYWSPYALVGEGGR